MKLSLIKTIIGILVGIGALVGLLYGIEKYFAKSSEVSPLAKRVDLGSHDDRVIEAERMRDRIKQHIMFERRTEAPSAAEDEALKEAEENIDRRKKEREEREKEWAEKKSRK